MNPVTFIEAFFASRIGEVITHGLVEAAVAVAEHEAPVVIKVLEGVLAKKIGGQLSGVVFAGLKAAAEALVAEVEKPAAPEAAPAPAKPAAKPAAKAEQ